jgi:hypothetical protein
MFSSEEFSGYDAREGFDWDKIIGLLYSDKAKGLAKDLLRQRNREPAKL